MPKFLNFLNKIKFEAVSILNSNYSFFLYLLRLLDEWTFVALDVVGRIKLLTRLDVFDAMPFKLLSLPLLPLAPLEPPDRAVFDTETVFRNAGRCGELIEGGVIELELVEFFVYD